MKVIVKCHLGNGLGYREGVDTTADKYYQAHIANFGEAEVIQFLKLFNDPDFAVDVDSSKPHKRTMALAAGFKKKTKNVHVLSALDSVLAQPEGTLRKLASVTKFKQALASIPK